MPSAAKLFRAFSSTSDLALEVHSWNSYLDWCDAYKEKPMDDFQGLTGGRLSGLRTFDDLILDREREMVAR